MTLGMAAVGIIIFLLVGMLSMISLECTNIYTGVSMAIIILVCLYCAVSGTYLLHLEGKI